ncbi:MAG TPA: FAD-binding oxidoreductase [Solirubrobacteraceae bacterium]|nr:FAD-binding oxidoreductase [Solirubrobacteraceae bacterium]
MRSWWLSEAGDGDGEPQAGAALEGSHRAEVCIVGGGFTGLWTALRIKEHAPQTEVALVEADICGGGPSGRNGGFALSFWHHFAALDHACGSVEALRLARASCDAIDEIGAFCEEHGIDAHYRHDGWLWTATNAAQVGAWNSTIADISSHGEEPFVAVEPAELVERTGSSSHIAGVFEATAATIQPALLARNLLRVARERGVRVFEGSPMLALERSTPLVVRTAGGDVTADRVVLAINAWSGQVRELRRAFVVVSSDIAITDPVPDALQNSGWRDGSCISDSRLMVNYYRTTRDGRIALGKGGGRLAYGTRIDSSFSGRSPVEADLAARLRLLYPFTAAVPVTASWTGPIDRTVDGLPFFTALGRPDLVCGAGYSGNGVGPSVLGGRILASMALGLDDEWARCGLVRRPPRGMPGEPARYVGGNIVRNAVGRKERAEDDGRPVSAADRALAGLAPAGLVPLD